MRICFCSWALETCKKFGIRTYFGSVTIESVRGFRHFAFWRHGFKLATFWIVHINCFFRGASFEPIQNLATLNPEKLQGFHGAPLFHCYTLKNSLMLYVSWLGPLKGLLRPLKGTFEAFERGSFIYFAYTYSLMLYVSWLRPLTLTFKAFKRDFFFNFIYIVWCYMCRD